MQWLLNKFKHLGSSLNPRSPVLRFLRDVKLLILKSFTQRAPKLPTFEEIQSEILSGERIQLIWRSYTHRELKEIFMLGSSPIISQHITSLKLLASKTTPHHRLITATLIIMSLKGRRSEVLNKYLSVILSPSPDDNPPRVTISAIIPGQSEEILRALEPMSDKQLLAKCPETYEALTLSFVNSLSDIGSLLQRSPNGIGYPSFRNFQDLAQKITRRWNLLYAPYLKFPDHPLISRIDNLSFFQFKVRAITNTSELFQASVDLENCLYTYASNLKKNEKALFVLEEKQVIKYICEVDLHLKIIDLKGPYNQTPSPEFKNNLQNFLFSKGIKT